MTSSDLKRFYELHFEKGFQISKTTLKFSHDIGYQTEVELFKDDKREFIKSDEDDFASVLRRFRRIVDSDGSMKLAKIDDSEKYFEAMSEFGENREIKISKALEDTRTGRSPLEEGFWHRIDKALVKLLFEETSLDDSDILWLRENYFHIFASYLIEVKGINRLQQNVLFYKHKERQSLANTTETILRESFLSKQELTNPIGTYKTYRRYLPDSLEDHSVRVAMQLEYLKDLSMMLTEVGSQEEGVRILYVLDVYRRVYEMTRPILDLLRVALLLGEGIEVIQRDVTDDTIISVLTNHNYAELVDAFHPQIRHCESHLDTRIMESKRTVLFTQRKGLRRSIIQEFKYEEIVGHMEHLRNTIFPALYQVFASFDGFLKLMLMNSVEYQLLLISKTAV
ncbi:MAG: hypothetical protein ACXADD_15040 [Candidatus Thorarchaeota archaeon]|jgi:hypothetical protein